MSSNDKKQNNATPKKGRMQLPGNLVAQPDTLLFHNKHSKMLIEGRKPDRESGKPAIIGLLMFASITKQIIKAAQGDDPYADWYLLRLEESDEKLAQQIDHYQMLVEKKVSEQLPKEYEINFTEVHSQDPAMFEINWGANPYASRCAFKLKRVDDVLCMIWLARHKGLLTRDDATKLSHKLQHKVRGFMSIVLSWRVFGCTRADYTQNIQRAQKAKEHFKFELPEAILSRELRGQFAPNINPAIVQDTKSSVLDD